MNLRDTLDYLARLVQQDADRMQAAAPGESPEQLLAVVEHRATIADAVTAETKRLMERRTATLRQRAERAEKRADHWKRVAEEMEASRDHEAAARQAQQDADRFRADHLAACRTIADMHEAATGRTGMGPIRGVVEDVADMRARAEQAEAGDASAVRLAQSTAAAWQKRAEEAERDRDRAREQRNTWARQADAEILEHRQRAETASVLGARYMGEAERYQAAWHSARERAQREAGRHRIVRASRLRWKRRALAAEQTLDAVRDLAHRIRAGSPQGAAAIYADRIEQTLDTTPEN